MKNFVKILLTVALVFVMTGSANAWFLDFEWGLGLDAQPIASGVPGVQFTTTDGFDWHYGDATTNNYNVINTDGTSWLSGGYYMAGNVFAWLGTSQGAGRIDFTNQDGSWFQTSYGSTSTMHLEAYDAFDNLISSTTGASNYNVGLSYIAVTSGSNNIAYVLIHDTGNQFVLDNMSGDASGVTSPGIPEPATMLLFGAGLMGLGAKLRRKK